MKIIAFLLLFLTACSTPLEQAFVTEVVDGDTITIAGGARVRLLGINAPERGETGYEPPKNLLKQLILNKEVTLEQDGKNTDVYGRLLRHVFINNTLVTETLAEQGLVRAKFYVASEKYRNRIAEAESHASTEGRGIWSLETRQAQLQYHDSPAVSSPKKQKRKKIYTAAK